MNPKLNLTGLSADEREQIVEQYEQMLDDLAMERYEDFLKYGDE